MLRMNWLHPVVLLLLFLLLRACVKLGHWRSLRRQMFKQLACMSSLLLLLVLRTRRINIMISESQIQDMDLIEQTKDYLSTQEWRTVMWATPSGQVRHLMYHKKPALLDLWIFVAHFLKWVDQKVCVSLFQILAPVSRDPVPSVHELSGAPELNHLRTVRLSSLVPDPEGKSFWDNTWNWSGSVRRYVWVHSMRCTNKARAERCD